MRTFNEIASDYRPYDRLPAFEEGAAAYLEHVYRNPYDGVATLGVHAQAWDRGLEAAARFTRQFD